MVNNPNCIVLFLTVLFQFYLNSFSAFYIYHKTAAIVLIPKKGESFQGYTSMYCIHLRRIFFLLLFLPIIYQVTVICSTISSSPYSAISTTGDCTESII